MSQKSKHIFDLISSQGLVYGRVDVGWAIFDIKLVSGLKSGESTCWGTCDFYNYVISLEKKMEDAPARETLLHEICHIFLDFCGLGGAGDESEESITTSNEAMTITMYRAMLMFARLNPELAKELLCLN